jgi:hypothetical protein
VCVCVCACDTVPSPLSPSHSGAAAAQERVLSLKNELLPMLSAIFAAIYSRRFLADAEYLAFSDQLTWDQALQVTDVQFQLPGVPPPETLERYWRMGQLKREAMVSTLSARLGVPWSMWEPQSKLSLEQLAGIPPPQPAGADGKPKPPKPSPHLKPPGTGSVFAPEDTAKRAQAAAQEHAGAASTSK